MPARLLGRETPRGLGQFLVMVPDGLVIGATSVGVTGRPRPVAAAKLGLVNGDVQAHAPLRGLAPLA